MVMRATPAGTGPSNSAGGAPGAGLHKLAAEFTRGAKLESEKAFTNTPGTKFANFGAFLQDLLQRAKQASAHDAAAWATFNGVYQEAARYDALRIPERASLLVRCARAVFATPGVGLLTRA